MSVYVCLLLFNGYKTNKNYKYLWLSVYICFILCLMGTELTKVQKSMFMPVFLCLTDTKITKNLFIYLFTSVYLCLRLFTGIQSEVGRRVRCARTAVAWRWLPVRTRGGTGPRRSTARQLRNPCSGPPRSSPVRGRDRCVKGKLVWFLFYFILFFYGLSICKRDDYFPWVFCKGIIFFKGMFPKA